MKWFLVAMMMMVLVCCGFPVAEACPIQGIQQFNACNTQAFVAPVVGYAPQQQVIVNPYVQQVQQVRVNHIQAFRAQRVQQVQAVQVHHQPIQQIRVIQRRSLFGR